MDRHELELLYDHASALERCVRRVLEIEQRSSMLSSYLVGTIDEAERALACSTVVDAPPPPLLARAVALGGRAGAARFRAAALGAFSTHFGGPTVLVPGDGPDSCVHPVRFRKTWCLLYLTGETEGLGWLRQVPIALTTRSSTTTDVREHRICEALLALQEGRAVRPILADALDGATRSTSRRALPVATSMVELLRSLDDDASAFDAALVRHLEAHRKFWRPKSLRTDAHGAVALTALALVAVALSRGWRVGVESDYLPISMFR